MTTNTAADHFNGTISTTPFTALHNHANKKNSNSNNNNITVAASSDPLLEDVNKRLVLALLNISTTVTHPCAKLLRQGGRYCRRVADGEK